MGTKYRPTFVDKILMERNMVFLYGECTHCKHKNKKLVTFEDFEYKPCYFRCERCRNCTYANSEDVIYYDKDTDITKAKFMIPTGMYD